MRQIEANENRFAVLSRHRLPILMNADYFQYLRHVNVITPRVLTSLLSFDANCYLRYRYFRAVLSLFYIQGDSDHRDRLSARLQCKFQQDDTMDGSACFPLQPLVNTRMKLG